MSAKQPIKELGCLLFGELMCFDSLDMLEVLPLIQVGTRRHFVGSERSNEQDATTVDLLCE